MSAPATEELRELERELLLAAESGETRTIADLRDRVGVGHDDLMGMLDTLRVHARAVEAAPGEWRGPLMDEIDEPRAAEPVRVSLPDDEPDEPDEGGGVLRAGLAAFGPAATVRLTRAIADRLDESALGQIVKAGLEGVDDHEPFVLEVLP